MSKLHISGLFLFVGLAILAGISCNRSILPVEPTYQTPTVTVAYTPIVPSSGVSLIYYPCGGSVTAGSSLSVTLCMGLCNSGAAVTMPVTLVETMPSNSGGFQFLGWGFNGTYPYTSGTSPNPTANGTTMVFPSGLAAGACVTLTQVLDNYYYPNNACQSSVIFNNVYWNSGGYFLSIPVTLTVPCLSTTTPTYTVTATTTITPSPTQPVSVTSTKTPTVTPTATTTSTACPTNTLTSNPTNISSITATLTVTASSTWSVTPTPSVVLFTTTPTQTITTTAWFVPTFACSDFVNNLGNFMSSMSPITLISGDVYYTGATAFSSGVINQIAFYGLNTGASVSMAIYSNNGSQPGSPLGSGGIVSSVAGWNYITVASPINITSGSNYWLAIQPENTLLIGNSGMMGNFLTESSQSSLSVSYPGGGVLTQGWLCLDAGICLSSGNTSTPTPTTATTVLPTSTETVTPTCTIGVMTFVKSESATSLTAGQTVTYTLCYNIYDCSADPMEDLVLMDNTGSSVSYLGQSSENAGAAVTFNGSGAATAVYWDFPSLITSDVSGCVTWWGIVQCPSSGSVSDIAQFTYYDSKGLETISSNAVGVQVQCTASLGTSTATPTPSSTITPTMMVTPTVTATSTATLTVTASSTWSVTPTPSVVLFTTTPTQTITTTAWFVPTFACSDFVNNLGNFMSSMSPITLISGDVYYTGATAFSSGVINQIAFYGLNTGASVSMAIYSNNGSQPGSPLGSGGIVSSVAGWNYITVASPINITSGSNYWLAIQPENTLLIGNSGMMGNFLTESSQSSLSVSYPGGGVLTQGWLCLDAGICLSSGNTSTPTPTTATTVLPTSTETVTPTCTIGVMTFVKSESATSLTAGQTVTYTLCYNIYDCSADPMEDLVLMDNTGSSVSYLGQSSENAGAAVTFNGSGAATAVYWDFPSLITSDVSGCVTWWGIVQCPSSGSVSDIAQFTYYDSKGLETISSNAVGVQVQCTASLGTSTATPTPSSTITPTMMVTPTVTATSTATLTVTASSTWSVTPTPSVVLFTTTPTQTITTTAWFVPTFACSDFVNNLGNFMSSMSPITLISGDVYYTGATAFSSGVINQIAFYGLNTGASVSMAIYSNNGSQPGSPLGSGGIVSSVAGWNYITVASPINITSGSNYWLAIQPENTLLIGNSGMMGNFLTESSQSSLSVSYPGGGVLTQGWLCLDAGICLSSGNTSTPTPTTATTVLPTSTETVTPTCTIGVMTFVKSESATSLTAGQTVTYTLCYNIYDCSADPMEDLVLMDNTGSSVSYLGQSSENAGAAVTFNGSGAATAVYWDFPSLITSDVSGCVTWWGIVQCPSSGSVSDIAQFTYYDSKGLETISSNAVGVQVQCTASLGTSTATPTPSSTITPTMMVTPTVTATSTATQ